MFVEVKQNKGQLKPNLCTWIELFQTDIIFCIMTDRDTLNEINVSFRSYWEQIITYDDQKK